MDLESVFLKYNYDNKTGKFFWKYTRGRSVRGHEAGYLINGYRYLSINNKKILAHRVVYFIETNEYIEGPIDHIDRNPDNNSFKNLRVCKFSENSRNRKVQSNNKLGVKGVYQLRCGKFKSEISINGKSINLGTFKTLEEAKHSYITASKALHKEFSIFN